MAYWKYLPIIKTIKGLLNKKLSLSIIVVLRQNFLNLLLRSLFWVKFINVAVVTQNWNNIVSNVYVSTAAPFSTFLITRNSGLSISAHFHKNSLIETCCTFCRFEIRTLTPNRLKNQTNDTLKLLGHNCNHERGLLKQKVVTFRCYVFNLKFPKHC